MAKIKQAALDKRYTFNPERFVNGRPNVKLPPTEVAINPISVEDIAKGVVDVVSFLALHAIGYEANAH